MKPGSNSIVTEFFWSLRLSTKRQRIFHPKSVHNLLTHNSVHSTDTQTGALAQVDILQWARSAVFIVDCIVKML